MPVAFIIGAGRSGTTILGRAFSLHPDVVYLYEPVHRWRCVNPRTDLTRFLGDGPMPAGILSAGDATEAARSVFSRVFLQRVSGPLTAVLEANEPVIALGRPETWLSQLRAKPRLVLEKTPINALRIGFLNELAPSARYIHIVRDGVEVARSIAHLARTNEYRVAGRRQLNQWWGDDDIKWKVLAQEGVASGHASETDVAALRSHEQRGAFEWLLSILEVRRWVEGALREQIVEVMLPQLAADPRSTLAELCTHLGLSAPLKWLDRAAALFVAKGATDPETIELPTAMSETFNDLQSRYGLKGVASATG